jgi:arylsulfatase A-like enzyme
MNVRSGIRLLLCVLSVWGAAVPAAPPNVILIVTDDQGYGDMACHGNPWLKTPNLDRLHGESVRLEDYHVDPVCTPTRAALMTGRYAVRVGAWTTTEGRQMLNPDETTMAQVFAASGYHTGMFGKWHLGDTRPYAPRFRGFQEVVRHLAGGIDEIGNPAGNGHFDPTLFRNGKPEKFKGFCTDIFFSEAMKWIDTLQTRNQEQGTRQPFFLYLPLNAMHSPFTVADRYWKRFVGEHPEARAKFYGMIESFDENLGRLFAALKRLDVDRNTIVIFMGDNGTAMGTDSSGRSGFNAGMRGKKGSVHEGGHRVACFVRWPAGLKAGVEITQLTSVHDWLPTLIDLCGLTPPAGVRFDGRSIAPLLRDQKADWPGRTLVVERQGGTLSRRGPGASGRGRRSPQFAVLNGRWRLVNGELHDLVADPGQQRNVAARHPEVATRLWSAYEKHFADVASHGGEPMPFFLGGAEESRTTLTVRDWRPTEGAVIWKQEQLGDDSLAINGYWTVEVRSAGRYRFTLSRHPVDDLKPIGADRARLRIGDMEKDVSLKPDASQAVFDIDLVPGRARLQTWFTESRTGRQRGAYFVTVSRL